MASKSEAGVIPENLRYAMESLVRIANEEKFALIGFVLRDDPACISMFRNTKDDPATFMRVAADLVDKKKAQGLINNELVTPVN